MTKLTASALANTQRTVESYEASASQYDTLVDARRPPHIEDALRRLVQCLPLGGSVLEIGSGPGRDADLVESLGAVVRRTDATQAFLDLMADRGRKADLLNVVTDELGGPYDGVLAMAVLIHVDREQNPAGHSWSRCARAKARRAATTTPCTGPTRVSPRGSPRLACRSHGMPRAWAPTAASGLLSWPGVCHEHMPRQDSCDS